MLEYVFNEDLKADEPMRLCAYDQCWDQETRNQLKDEYNIIFGTKSSSVLPIMIVYRKDAEPLFVIGSEDDGTITFDRQYGQFRNCFSSGWARSLISDLEEALRICKENGSNDSAMEELKHIYLITTFSKCEPKEQPWEYDLGYTRSVGWRPTFEMAEETVINNMCDIWEYSYDYACIEELDYGLYPYAENRWFYKFNEKTGKYEEIDEPALLKGHGPIGGIG